MELYREIIMDHYKNPRNKGSLDNPTNEATTTNGSCGDKIKVQLFLEDKKIKDIKFSGYGCAISQAAASLLTEEIKNKKIEEINSIKNEDIFKLLGIEIEPLRIKCASLALEAIRNSIKNGTGN